MHMEGEEYKMVQYEPFLLNIRQRYNLDNKDSKSGHIYIKCIYGDFFDQVWAD